MGRVDRVLFVDDEASILTAFKRQLRSFADFSVDTVLSGEKGLELIKEARNTYAVVVSDMRMVGMDGTHFLNQVRSVSPNTVRIMLTGNIDQRTVVEAVNSSNIFRFLNKPCSAEHLAKAINDGREIHHLMVAEKELLQKTLNGSVKVLTDVLALIDPEAFGRGKNLRHLIHEIAPVVGVPSAWDIELAAMLAEIGRVAVPTELTLKLRKGQHLLPEEREILEKVPEYGRDLLSNIPRLERVAQSVYYQNKNFDGSGFPSDELSGEKIPVGARLLRILRGLAESLVDQKDFDEALNLIQQEHGLYDPKMLNLIEEHRKNKSSGTSTEVEERYEITVSELLAGQRILSSVKTKSGILLVAEGAVVSDAMLTRLKNYARFIGLDGPIVVDARIPGKDSGPERGHKV